MATMGIDGLSSGLDTTSLINSLMQVEAMPQTLLKASITSTTSFVSALQALNAKVASLATNAKTAALPASWGAVRATSSASSVTATASAAAQASSVSFTVDLLAAAQTSVSAATTDFASLFGGTLTIATGATATTGTTVTAVDLSAVTDLAGVASAINKADAGVSATVVKVSATESRLQLTGKAPGADAAFDLYGGTVLKADIQAGTAPVALISRGDAITSSGDAQITLWGTQSVTSASNTFTGLLSGVDLTVTAKETSAVTVTVARNDAALTKLASDLVGSLGVVLSEIASRTATTTTSADDGGSVITGGLFSGDSATRALQQAVLSAASYPVDGTSPSTVGIVIGRDGTVTFDAAKFATALAADPTKVQTIVAGLAARIADVATAASEPLAGSLSLKIAGQQTLSKSMSEQVTSWDRRLALRREGLQATYTAMEVMLSKLKSQGDWLTSQLDALSANTSSSS